MELSELRQRWQQAAAAPQPPAGHAPEGLLDEAVLVLISCVTGLLVVKDHFWRVWTGMMLAVCVVMLPYYVRKWQLIRRLRDPAGSVWEHTRRQVRGIRGLIRLYYRATMWSIVPWLGLLLFFTAGLLERQLHGPGMWLGLSLLGGFIGVFGAGMYFMMRSFTRWYLQKVYGQHLDLEEPARR